MFNESFYRDILAQSLNGKTEISTPVGRIDVLTDTELIEVKNSKDWKSALGQVMAYSVYHPDKTKRIHLIGLPNKAAEAICKLNNVVLTWQPEINAPEKETKVLAYDLDFEEEASAIILDFSKTIKDFNKLVRKKGGGLNIEVIGKKHNMYFRGTFPGKDKKEASVRGRLSLGLRATDSNSWKIAEDLCLEMSKELALETFEWGKWTREKLKARIAKLGQKFS